VLLVPQMTAVPPVWRGTGKIDAPAGNGTFDWLMHSRDLTHPPSDGHLILGRDIVLPGIISALRAWLSAQ
jgi:hypothetical protein